MNKLQTSACLLLFALSTPSIAQEAPGSNQKRLYEVGALPFRYHIDNKFQYKNSYWQPVASVYLNSYIKGSNFSWVAQLEYAARNTDDACEGCTDMGDSEFSYRSLNLTLAARQTWGQRANSRWQAFVQPGIFLGYNNFSGYRIGGWTGISYYSHKAFAYGLDLGLGLKFMVTPRIPFTLTSKLLIGWESRNNNPEIVANTSASPLQLGLGYIF